MRISSLLMTVALSVVVVSLPADASAQLLSQSELTFADVDPSFELTLEHLAMDSRWLGLSPRNVTWSADGEWIYFRWREDPAPEQEFALDPWYAVNREGTEVRMVPEEEVDLIPFFDIQYSRNLETAIWSRGGAIYHWTEEQGARRIYVSAGNVGGLDLAPDGLSFRFSIGGDDNVWVYDLEARRIRQLAEIASREDEDYGEAEQWLRDQQLELFEFIQENEEDEALYDSLAIARSDAWEPQAVPVDEGEADDLQVSPGGDWATFQWEKGGSEEETHYLAYVTRSGRAEPETSRAKVGLEDQVEYGMGIVRVDPSVPTDSIEVVWVEDGVEKETIIHGPYWNPQGTVALVQMLSLDHNDRWIARLDPETGETTVIFHQHVDDWIGGPLVGGRLNPGWIEWLPEGDAFGFVSERTGWAMLYLGEPDGTVTQLTFGEWEVRNAQLSHDGDTWNLMTSKEHPGEEHLYHLPARGGELVRVTLGQGMYEVEFSPDGERLAVSFESREMREDLYVMDNEPGSEMRRITKSGTDAYYRYDWAESEIITFPAPSGEPTWAEVWERPETPNGAAVMHVHGCGPCAQAVDKGWGGGVSLYANYMRDRGYVMASLDYRGSSGYGHENRTSVFESMGHEDVDSSLPFLDILVEDYGVDRNSIGLYGCSYGGFYTLMALLRHPGAFAAGVAQCSVTDWAHYNQGYTSRILNGTPVENPEAYRRSSPIYFAENLQDALQIQHGLEDGNVQIQDVFRLTERFLELGKDFDLVIYPTAGHGWGREAYELDSYKRMTRWFDRHLVGQTATALIE